MVCANFTVAQCIDSSMLTKTYESQAPYGYALLLTSCIIMQAYGKAICFHQGGELSKCHEAGEKLLKPQRVSKLSGDSDSDASLSPTHKQGTPMSPESPAQDVPHDTPLVPEQASSLPKDSR
jgi:hypothetical protein